METWSLYGDANNDLSFLGFLFQRKEGLDGRIGIDTINHATYDHSLIFNRLTGEIEPISILEISS